MIHNKKHPTCTTQQSASMQPEPPTLPLVPSSCECAPPSPEYPPRHPPHHLPHWMSTVASSGTLRVAVYCKSVACPAAPASVCLIVPPTTNAHFTYLVQRPTWKSDHMCQTEQRSSNH